MRSISICVVDGCRTRIGLFTYPPLCDDCRQRLDDRRVAEEAKRRERLEAESDRGRPGDLQFIPKTNHEKKAHKTALGRKNYGNGRP